MKPRRVPPTQAKLEQLLAEISGAYLEGQVSFKASDAIRKLYNRGLPSGLTPAVVTAAVVAVSPYGFELQRMTKRVGAEYDAAILEGLAQTRASYGALYSCDLILTASLSARRGLSIASAWERVAEVERLVVLSPRGNVPLDFSPVKLDLVAEAMAAWFAPDLVLDTLALADEKMPPTLGSQGDRRWVNPPQSSSCWAWLIACALHPSEGARAALEPRAACVAGLDEPARSVFAAILAHASRLHGALGAAPQG